MKGKQHLKYLETSIQSSKPLDSDEYFVHYRHGNMRQICPVEVWRYSTIVLIAIRPCYLPKTNPIVSVSVRNDHYCLSRLISSEIY